MKVSRRKYLCTIFRFALALPYDVGFPLSQPKRPRERYPLTSFISYKLLYIAVKGVPKRRGFYDD
jgi:hypothetical protein